ncbi:GNAT family N-acetyltransferase [Leifsonia sp. F6_8S_P_1B]|uniref:GNAT family N-acetyltransferase n=1 Tax=Leifsonia williamsii TaxID=3035919 RepID=A0ABT8K9C2_9MICO|nr:GNAT family N-acetyltransferase [Leifsonia williamsii]MDN4613082.1 GNAT family N-acetyltransferase [Leifsonia williamsii]
MRHPSTGLDPALLDPALLDGLADRGWPALDREPLGPWTLRAAAGVTNRANSVLTVGEPDDLDAAIASAERWYAVRDLPAVFQVSPATPAALAPALTAHGYRERSPTDIMVADTLPAVASHADRPVEVEVAPTPSDAWLDTWWSVDGRGGATEREVARRILTGGPALYASTGDPEAPDAVARLAIVGEWGGLYAVATRPSARRRGLARTLMQALAAEAPRRGVERLWLQVLAGNAPAHALYASLGFRRASGYSYFTR